jgi:small subunit ribosomal protein S8
MLTRIRNAVMVRHESVQIPSSKMKLAIAKIMKEEGFITDYDVQKGKTHPVLTIKLKYNERNESFINGLERISKPGLKVYIDHKEIPRIAGGMGVAIISTSKGVITGQQAWREGIGGEYLCYVV